MPAKKEYTADFKEQAVRFVLEESEPDESRKHACDGLAPKLSVKAVTLHNWVKQYAPGPGRPAAGVRQTVCVNGRDDHGLTASEAGDAHGAGDLVSLTRSAFPGE